MSGNTLGTLFAVTTFGESHGPAIGCVIDGCPPGLALSSADIQPDLDRRKPGTSRHVTQRKEDDAVEILSGVFEGVTTGTPRPSKKRRMAVIPITPPWAAVARITSSYLQRGCGGTRVRQFEWVTRT